MQSKSLIKVKVSDKICLVTFSSLFALLEWLLLFGLRLKCTLALIQWIWSELEIKDFALYVCIILLAHHVLKLQNIYMKIMLKYPNTNHFKMLLQMTIYFVLRN